jgi:hypothetical protein
MSHAQQVSYPDTADVATLDGIINAYYEVVSVPAGRAADRARDESIHHPSALVAISGVDPNGNPTLRTMTLAQYHEDLGGPRDEGFFEWEIHRVTERFGNVAHVWSTYASSDEPNGAVRSRGINSIQLYFDGDRWWITSWIFDTERPGNEIPSRFLPGQ